MPASMVIVLEGSRRPEQLAQVARQLSADLSRQPQLEVREATRPAAPGERGGEVALLGQIALTFLSGGAATALVTCLNTYLTRDKSLIVRVKGADGRELVIDGKRLAPEDIPMITDALAVFASAPPGRATSL